MPVISTAFDDDFFDEPVIEADRSQSPCKKKCSKNTTTKKYILLKIFVYFKECDMNIYEPVCDIANRETYQNPCLLGCKKILKGKYANCLCLPNNSTVTVGKLKLFLKKF